MNVTTRDGYNHSEKPEREITLADFPARQADWLPSAKQYFRDHHITIRDLTQLKTVYPTIRGICYVLSGKLCFQERITIKDYPVRFLSPGGGLVGKTLFIPRQLTRKDVTVFIVEGLTDAVAVCQSGYAAISLVGANTTDHQHETLREFSSKRNLILIPDNDKAGDDCTAVLTREIPSLRVRNLPIAYKDICDCDYVYRDRFLAGAIKR